MDYLLMSPKKSDKILFDLGLEEKAYSKAKRTIWRDEKESTNCKSSYT